LSWQEGCGTITLMAETNNKDAASVQPQPGQVVTPGGTPAPAPQAPAPSASAKPPAPAPQAPAPAQQPSPYVLQTEGAPAASAGGVNWTASEFVAHEKSTGWYGGLAIAAVIIAAFVYLLTKDKISTTVVVVAALALGVLGARKPRQLRYQLDEAGFSIGQKHYSYEMFRSFSVVPEGAFSSIVFMPLKRFAPVTTLYYPPESEDKILDVLAQRLPFEDHKADAVDSLMRRIRF
jgi:hypothetical protein